MKLNETEKRTLLDTPVIAVLSYYGKRLDHQKSLYFSPFRDERTPSFEIKGSLWHDYGEDSKGGLLDLISRLSGKSKSEAWEVLAQINRMPITQEIKSQWVSTRKTSSEINIIRVEPFRQNDALLAYAISRGISEEIIQMYTRKVSYYIGNNKNAIHSAIGFPSGKEFWVLRGRSPKSKRCSGSDISLIDVTGTFTDQSSSDAVSVFEGFFDFLSFMMLNNWQTPMEDILVLNSVSNVDRALPVLEKYDFIHCYTDMDAAGRKAYQTILEKNPQAVVTDDSSALLDGTKCKDINEYLVRKEN